MLSALLRRLLPQLVSRRSGRRLEPRGSRIDGRISLGGRDYPLKDWSRRGFSAAGIAARHHPGDKLALSVEIDLDGEPLAFDCRAVVVWVDRERRELAGVFTELDRRIQEKIMRRVFARADRRPATPQHA
jgi:hypothetical protein